MLGLHKQLTEEWQCQRLNIPNISKELRRTIQEVIGEKQGTIIDTSHNTQSGPRKYCTFCNYKKKRLTTTYCIECERPVCGEHQKKNVLNVEKIVIFIKYCIL